MSSEAYISRESSVGNKNVMRSVSDARTFASERRMQQAYGLRNRPDRYTSLERARSGMKYYTKPHMIVEVGENLDGIAKGYYAAVPSDASRLEKKGFKVMSGYGK